MAKNDHFSGLELTIILAILQLGDNAYGVSIRQAIKDATDRDISRSLIYEILDRLEKRDLIESLLGEATPERGGRAKKYFKVTGNAASLARQQVNGLTNLSVGRQSYLAGAGARR